MDTVTAKALTALSEEDRGEVLARIVRGRNIVKACNYADVHFQTFSKAVYGGGLLRVGQRRKLMEYCARIRDAA